MLQNMIMHFSGRIIHQILIFVKGKSEQKANKFLHYIEYIYINDEINKKIPLPKVFTFAVLKTVFQK